MPAHDGLDLGIDESVEDAIDLGTGNVEDMCDALGFERTNQELGAVLFFRL